MLIRFAVENFLCFAERACLDLTSPSPITLLCGDNGAGKSALQKALSLVRNLVLGGSRPGQPVPVTPNLLLPPGPSRFELTIRHDDALWSYGFSATPQQIVEEWLKRDGGDGEKTLFTRRGTPVSIELGDSPAAERQRLELVAYGTRPEQLFLNEALRRGVTGFAPIGVWLRDRLQLILSETKVVGLAARAAREPDFADFLGQLLAEAGSGVVKVLAPREALDPDTFESEAEQRELVAALTSFADAFAETPDGELIAEQEGRLVDLYRVRLLCQLAAPSSGGPPVELPVSALSDGLQRLLHLAPLLHTRAVQPVYFVDDFDRSLATPLLRKLLGQFAQQGGGQLIATLHDPTPLFDVGPAHVIRMQRAAPGVTIRSC